ncbi:MAG: glucosaminidase domain-containing protein [Bacteroidota bacterium]
MRRNICVAFMLTAFLSVFGQRSREMSREEYIKTYSDLAMKEMARVGIPASITLAQGCLESNNGNSTLAVKGNNHFGIKCHDWTGRKVYHDDDRKNECFRSYRSAYDSYMDHSKFLSTRGRYSSLFELNPHDYRGWAKGLKKAGYATARNYSSLLIRIIEDNELYRYDLLVLEGGFEAGNDVGTETTEILPGHGYHTTREIMVNNKIEYIVTEPGDTPESLRKELDLYKNELYKYNNLYNGVELEPGQIIYLQPKRRKAAPGNEIHTVEEGQTMYDISQKYGVKLKHLYRMNRMMEGEQPIEGSEIYLRRKKREPVLKLEPTEDTLDEEIMEFRFDG